ncbi:MAG: class D beta-lactamase [Saprospiraceae bacterium]
MKPVYLLLFLLILNSCTEQKDAPQIPIGQKEIIEPPKQIANQGFQQILDAAEVNGVILIFDEKNNSYHSNDFERANQGFLPASTYKIPNSIIALETGVVEDENTIFKWDGEERALKIWEEDLTFTNALRKSCVPCYQDIARRIGVKRMNEYLEKLDYKNMVVDSSNLDLFWLEGDSKITAMEQINFLSRLYHSQLPISKKTEKIIKEMISMDKKTTYKLSGKTGWSIRNGNNLGWFVGYIEKGDEVYFVATNVDPKENFDMKNFTKIRLQVLMEATKLIGITS